MLSCLLIAWRASPDLSCCAVVAHQQNNIPVADKQQQRRKGMNKVDPAAVEDEPHAGDFFNWTDEAGPFDAAYDYT